MIITLWLTLWLRSVSIFFRQMFLTSYLFGWSAGTNCHYRFIISWKSCTSQLNARVLKQQQVMLTRTLLLVDVSKGLSFLRTCSIFHIYYPGVLIVLMCCVRMIPTCTQAPWADFSASFEEYCIHHNIISE